MAGHSQFKNIMHRKGAQDAKRSKQFARLSREIMVAAREGMADPAANPRLRTAISAARAANVPKDNIERAIRRGSGAEDGVTYEAIRYEGYGPGGVAIIVDALTDNRNRTASEVRAAFNKHEANLGETGSVAFMFDRAGQITYPAEAASADDMFEAALDAGASDADSGDDGHEIVCAPDDFHTVREALEHRFGVARSGGLVWRPQNTVAVDADTAGSLFKLLEALDDNDDVQSVSCNFEVADEVMRELSA